MRKSDQFPLILAVAALLLILGSRMVENRVIFLLLNSLAAMSILTGGLYAFIQKRRNKAGYAKPEAKRAKSEIDELEPEPEKKDKRWDDLYED